MHGSGALRTRLLATAAAAVAAAVTAAALTWDLRFADGGRGQVALDSAAATIAVTTSFLLYGRFRVGGLTRDVLLCGALLLLGAGNAVLSVLPAVVGDPVGRVTGAGLAAGLAAGLLFAAAVWAPAWRVPEHRRKAVAGGSLAAVALVLAVVSTLGRAGLAPGLGATDTFGGSDDTVVTAAQLTAAAAFAVAATGWCRTSVQVDRLAGPLAVASVLGAGSRLDFAVANQASSSLVSAGTLLRMLFYASLVAAAALEVSNYWRTVAEAAVLEERRRLARELHDGLAQELAFVATQARGLRDQSTNRRAQLIAGAAERALDESRRAIAALTRRLDEPIEVALGQTVEEVAGRFDTRVRLDVVRGVSVSPSTREALLRIAREAVTNAGRHGGAHSVVVTLLNGDGVTMRISDDGSGFEEADVDPRSGHFGLVSMRERAEALGGSVTVARRQPHGTTVEVHLP